MTDIFYLTKESITKTQKVIIMKDFDVKLKLQVTQETFSKLIQSQLAYQENLNCRKDIFTFISYHDELFASIQLLRGTEYLGFQMGQNSFPLVGVLFRKNKKFREKGQDKIK